MEYQDFIDYQIEFLPFGFPEITQDDLMYFEFNENWKEDLLRSANFYVEALEHNAVYLKIPVKVIFIADYSQNARAWVFDGRGLIIWHGGLLLRQMEMLERHQAILESLTDSPLSNLLRYIDNHPSILFFQMVQHFTFYHEFGHVIQNQDRERGNIRKYDPGLGFELQRHLLEIDADEFSALCLATHVLQYAHGLFHQVNEDIITRMVAFFLVPILTDSVLLFPGEISNFNMEQGTHPHPLFRVLFIAMVVAEFVNQRYRDEFRIEHHEMLNYTIDIASRLTGVNLAQLWADHYLNLLEYFRNIRQAPFPDGFKSAVDAWNEEIEQRKD